jgi:hypothetical protein
MKIPSSAWVQYLPEQLGQAEGFARQVKTRKVLIGEVSYYAQARNSEFQYQADYTRWRATSFQTDI